MIMVLDTSAAVEIVLKRNKSKVFRDLIASSDKIITSELFKIETANVLQKYYRGNYINRDDCLKLLNLSVALIDEFVPIENDYAEALTESIRLNYSACDMLYLILARKNGAALLTCDGPLNEIAGKEGIYIIKFFD